MSMPIRAYPLTWPEGWKRTPPYRQRDAKFKRASKQDWQGNWQHQRKLTINEATLRVRQALQRMGLSDDDIVISTNLALRLDGQPKSGQSEPSDPGVAVYWGERCIAIDQYERVVDNLAAIAATLEAMRAIERHGGAEILDRAFTGFVALPSPDSLRWFQVLDVSADAARPEIDMAYRRLRAIHHPDKGGKPDEFQKVQRAYEQATAR